jgi:hypothetical protein
MVDYLATRAAALSPAEIRARVRSAMEEFEAAFADLSEEDARARPIAGKWTIGEVLDHVAQSQVRAAEELRHLVAGRRPPMPPVYEGLRSGAPAWAPLAQLIADVREANRALLDAIPEESDSEAKGVAVIVANSKLADGSMKPQIFLHDVNWREYALLQRLHLLDHRRQIRELREAICAGARST